MCDTIKGKPPLDLYQAVREIACRLDEVIDYLNNNDPAFSNVYVRTFNGHTGDVVGVSSVNGQTGDVEISVGGTVDSVNGKTGEVTLTGDDISLSASDNQSISGVIDTLYGPDNAPPYPVTSVNTKTGAVELKGSDISVSNDNNESIATELDKKYDASNPPPYPVTSVNGQTGDVEISTGGGAVDSVNGKTGAVLLTASDINAAEGGTVQQSIDTFSSGIDQLENDVNTLQQGVSDLVTEVNEKYSASNPPPYPVTMVNNQTGAITVRQIFSSNGNGRLAIPDPIADTYYMLYSQSDFNGITTSIASYFDINNNLHMFIQHGNGESTDSVVYTDNNPPPSSGITYKGVVSCTVSGSGTSRVTATFSGLSNYIGGNGFVVFKYRCSSDSSIAVYFNVDGAAGFHTALVGGQYGGGEGSFTVPLPIISGTNVSVVSSNPATSIAMYNDGFTAYVYN